MCSIVKQENPFITLQKLSSISFSSQKLFAFPKFANLNIHNKHLIFRVVLAYTFLYPLHKMKHDILLLPKNKSKFPQTKRHTTPPVHIRGYQRVNFIFHRQISLKKF